MDRHIPLLHNIFYSYLVVCLGESLVPSHQRTKERVSRIDLVTDTTDKRTKPSRVSLVFSSFMAYSVPLSAIAVKRL